MRTRNLPPDAPGRYLESHPNPYYIPDKLPLSSKIEMDDELASSVADAMFQLGRIDGISPTVDFSPAHLPPTRESSRRLKSTMHLFKRRVR